MVQHKQFETLEISSQFCESHKKYFIQRFVLAVNELANGYHYDNLMNADLFFLVRNTCRVI